jgi:hypothetical protein
MMGRERSGDLHDAERNPGGLGEARAAGRDGNGLVVTAAAAKQITEFAVLIPEAPGGLPDLKPRIHRIHPVMLRIALG